MEICTTGQNESQKIFSLNVREIIENTISLILTALILVVDVMSRVFIFIKTPFYGLYALFDYKSAFDLLCLYLEKFEVRFKKNDVSVH